MITARITGLGDVRKAFADFGQELEKGPVARMVRRFGNATAKAAAAKAPVDDGVLRKGIKAKTLRKRDAERHGYAAASHVAARGLQKISRQMTPDEPVPPANYGAIVEVGSELHPPQPHLRPAAALLASGLASKVKADMAADVERVAKRAARKRAKATAP